MPSERFKRLPEEKQKKIRDACMAEYTRTTIEKASLNRMIEDAGISRGSFYTYFDSKWDVLGYLCESFINEFYECGVRCLEEAQGDIWEMLGQFLNGSLACAAMRDAPISSATSWSAAAVRRCSLIYSAPIRTVHAPCVDGSWNVPPMSRAWENPCGSWAGRNI